MEKYISTLLLTLLLTLTGCHATMDQQINGDNDQITIGVSGKPT